MEGRCERASEREKGREGKRMRERGKETETKRERKIIL